MVAKPRRSHDTDSPPVRKTRGPVMPLMHKHGEPEAARGNRSPRVCVYCTRERNQSNPTNAASAALSAVCTRVRPPSWERGVRHHPEDQSRLNGRAHRLREPDTAWWSLATCAPSSLEQFLHQNLFATCALRKWIERSSNRTSPHRGQLAQRSLYTEEACSAHVCRWVREP